MSLATHEDCKSSDSEGIDDLQNTIVKYRRNGEGVLQNLMLQHVVLMCILLFVLLCSQQDVIMHIFHL